MDELHDGVEEGGLVGDEDDAIVVFAFAHDVGHRATPVGERHRVERAVGSVALHVEAEHAEARRHFGCADLVSFDVAEGAFTEEPALHRHAAGDEALHQEARVRLHVRLQRLPAPRPQAVALGAQGPSTAKVHAVDGLAAHAGQLEGFELAVLRLGSPLDEHDVCLRRDANARGAVCRPKPERERDPPARLPPLARQDEARDFDVGRAGHSRRKAYNAPDASFGTLARPRRRRGDRTRRGVRPGRFRRRVRRRIRRYVRRRRRRGRRLGGRLRGGAGR